MPLLKPNPLVTIRAILPAAILAPLLPPDVVLEKSSYQDPAHQGTQFNFPLAATASMTYSGFMVIVETPIFTKQLLSTLSEEEYRLFQATLLDRPDAGKVMPGGGGLRKLRWAVEGRGPWWRKGNLLLGFGKGHHFAPAHVSKKHPGQSNPRPTQTAQEGR